MAASAPGTSSDTDAWYWVWFDRGRSHGEDGGRGHQRRADRPPTVEPWPGWGTAIDLDGVTGDEGHRRHLVALHQHADDLVAGGELGRGRQHLLDHHLAGVDGGVELLADEHRRAGGRHGGDVPRGGDGRRPEIAGVRTVPAGRFFVATTTDTRLAEDWNTAPATAAQTSTRAIPRPICQGRRWWVPADSRSPPRVSTMGGDAKVGRVGAVDVAMGAPVLSC